MPGQACLYSQPIEQRVNEMTSGVKADLAVKIFGDDMKTLLGLGRRDRCRAQRHSGPRRRQGRQVIGQPILQIRSTRKRSPTTASRPMQCSTSSNHWAPSRSAILSRRLPFPAGGSVARIVPRARVDQLGQILLPTAAGERIPLARLAKFETVEGASTISREWGQRRISVHANVRDRDLGSFVKEAQKAVDDMCTLPSARYRLEWGGQFEHCRAGLEFVCSSSCPSHCLRFSCCSSSPTTACSMPCASLRRTLRGRGRHLRAVAARHAVLDFRRRRLHRTFGRGSSRRMILVSYIRQLLDTGMPLNEAVIQGRQRDSARCS